MTNKNYGTYSLSISNSNQYLAEDPHDWWDISEPVKKGKKRKKKKKKKKAAKKRKKAVKKKESCQKREAEKKGGKTTCARIQISASSQSN